MGMYTSLRVKATVKEEYRPMLIKMHHSDAKWSEFVEQFPFLEEYSKLERAEFIPFGAVQETLIPGEWQDDKFCSEIDEQSGLWIFMCSLKDYDGEISIFFEQVLPRIISKAEYIEEFYEDWVDSQSYQLTAGTIQKNNTPDSSDEEDEENEEDFHW